MDILKSVLHHRSYLAKAFFAVAIIFSIEARVQAQSTGDTLSIEGIVGDVDQGRRAPVITYSTKVADDKLSATILADTQVINEDFKKYPISVDFFVNGKLFSKQFRSIELPAPLGIVVPKELAEVPFNYSIVATLLHPNRQYVTVAQGAVTGTSNSSDGALECTAVETVGEDATGVNVTGTINGVVSSENNITFTLTADDQSAEVSLNAPATASSTSRTATGTVKVQQAESEGQTYNVTGVVDASGTIVSSIDVGSTGGELTLKCSPVVTTAAATLVDGEDTDSSDTSLENSNLEDVLEAPILETHDGIGPNGEPNFVSLDQVDGVTEVN